MLSDGNTREFNSFRAQRQNVDLKVIKHNHYFCYLSIYTQALII